MEKIDNQEKEQQKEEQVNNNQEEEEEMSEDEEKNTIEEKNKTVNLENKPYFQRHFLSRSKTTKQKANYAIGKSIKSGASSFTNDSSLNNDPLSSSRDSEEKRRRRSFDIEYPSLKRSHSTKKYHYSKDYKDIIKEEKNEDEDSFCSFISNRSKFSSYTVMPKDNLYFLEKKKLFDENILRPVSTMEPVLETYDENLIFQKPKIPIVSDRKEDSKLNVIPKSTLKVNKAPLDENEIIQEVKELDGIFDEEFDQKLDSIKIKYKSFYDKEEPPALFSGLQGESKPFNDEVPDEIEEADFEDDAKEVIRKNSLIIQTKKKIADEIDANYKKPKKLSSKFLQLNEQKGLIDEKDELNNKEDNEEKEDEKDEEKEEESDKDSKNSKD